MGYQKSEVVKAAADALYAELKAARNRRPPRRPQRAPGVMFADMELIGVPHRLVIGERGLKEDRSNTRAPGCRSHADWPPTVAFVRDQLCAARIAALCLALPALAAQAGAQKA